MTHAEALWKRFTPPVTIWATEHAAVLQHDHDEILAAVRQATPRPPAA